MTAPFRQPPAQSARLDRELLARLAAEAGPVTLPALFRQSWAPRWAEDAADRLILAGRVRELDGGRLEVVAEGRRAAG